MENLFEFATRSKMRVASSRGELSVEQLWDVPLRSRDDFNLNSIAQAASRALKSATEDSFVDATKKTTAQVRLESALEVTKHVIGVKLDEEQADKRRTENRQEKEKLLSILAEKRDGKLSELSEKELQKRIVALEG